MVKKMTDEYVKGQFALAGYKMLASYVIDILTDLKVR